MTRHTPTELREMAEMLGDFRIETQARRDKQSDKIASMLRQAADESEDAERYRWLREHSRFVIVDDEPLLDIWPDNFTVFEEESKKLDERIDAARKETP